MTDQLKLIQNNLAELDSQIQQIDPQKAPQGKAYYTNQVYGTHKQVVAQCEQYQTKIKTNKTKQSKLVDQAWDAYSAMKKHAADNKVLEKAAVMSKQTAEFKAQASSSSSSTPPSVEKKTPSAPPADWPSSYNPPPAFNPGFQAASSSSSTPPSVEKQAPSAPPADWVEEKQAPSTPVQTAARPHTLPSPEKKSNLGSDQKQAPQHKTSALDAPPPYTPPSAEFLSSARYQQAMYANARQQAIQPQLPVAAQPKSGNWLSRVFK